MTYVIYDNWNKKDRKVFVEMLTAQKYDTIYTCKDIDWSEKIEKNINL